MRLGVGSRSSAASSSRETWQSRDGAVAEVGVRPAGPGGIAVPGFVDLHINGVAGIDFLTTDVVGLPARRHRPREHRRGRLPADLRVLARRRLHGPARGRRRGRRRPLRAAARHGRPPGGAVPLTALAGRARPGPLPHAGRGPGGATRERRPGAHGHAGAGAAGRPRPDGAAGRGRPRRRVRALGRRCPHGARRLRPRRPRDHPHPQRPPALEAARPRTWRRGAGAARRDRPGDRRRRPPGGRVGLRRVPRGRPRASAWSPTRSRPRCATPASRSWAAGACRSATARCAFPTARWPAAC